MIDGRNASVSDTSGKYEKRYSPREPIGGELGFEPAADGKADQCQPVLDRRLWPRPEAVLRIERRVDAGAGGLDLLQRQAGGAIEQP